MSEASSLGAPVPLNAEHEIAAILVHALDDRARRFYLNCGFVDSVIDELILFVRLKDVEAALGR